MRDGKNVKEKSCRMQLALLFISLFFLSQTVQADDLDAIYKRLVLARSLKCTFRVGLQADWRSGRLKTSPISSEELVLHFDTIDVKKGTARLIGNIGAANVGVMLTPSHLSFMEKTDIGNLNFTTVFAYYEKGTQNFVSVTSRHVTMLDMPLPSQHHGSCQVWE